MRPKVLIIGDYDDFKYHVFNNMDLAMQDILGDKMEVLCTEDYGELTSDRIKQYALVISYSDQWGKPISDEQSEGLISFVRKGGSFLVIHNGISLQARDDLKELIGAQFIGHPPYCRLTINVSSPKHDLVQGIADFDITDEPYQFEFVPEFETDIFLQYEYEGNTYPAGWTHLYGHGRVVYLMPGHDGSTFLNDAYRSLLRRVCFQLTGVE